MHDRQWGIGLDPWIVQDGNYGEFRRGQVAQFALEFYAERGLEPSAAPWREAEPIGDATYRIAAAVVASPPGTLVLDFGLLAYREEAASQDVTAAGGVTGDIYLGVDPFFYTESLGRMPGMPPLVYTWRVERILQETAPLVRDAETRVAQAGARGGVWVPDRSRREVVEVAETDAWAQDREPTRSLHYVLHCRLLDVPPRHTRDPA